MLIDHAECASAEETGHELSGDGAVTPPPAAAPLIKAPLIEFPLIEACAAPARSAAQTYEDLYGARRRSAAPAPRRSWPRPSGALAAVFACLAALTGAVAARETIVGALPRLAGLYGAVGLPVNLRGLRFDAVTSVTSEEPAGRVLAVSGTLTNIRAVRTPVPAMIVALKGPDGRDVYSWSASAPKAELAPGETVIFRTRLASPPDNALRTVIRFASAAETERAKGQK